MGWWRQGRGRWRAGLLPRGACAIQSQWYGGTRRSGSDAAWGTAPIVKPLEASPEHLSGCNLEKLHAAAPAFPHPVPHATPLGPLPASSPPAYCASAPCHGPMVPLGAGLPHTWYVPYALHHTALDGAYVATDAPKPRYRPATPSSRKIIRTNANAPIRGPGVGAARALLAADEGRAPEVDASPGPRTPSPTASAGRDGCAPGRAPAAVLVRLCCCRSVTVSSPCTCVTCHFAVCLRCVVSIHHDTSAAPGLHHPAPPPRPLHVRRLEMLQEAVLAPRRLCWRVLGLPLPPARLHPPSALPLPRPCAFHLHSPSAFG